jgi:hypothetical protein
MPLISVLWMLRQEDHDFMVILGYIERTCLKNKTKSKIPYLWYFIVVAHGTKITNNKYIFCTGQQLLLKAANMQIK